MSALLVGGILPNVVDDKALGEWCHQHLEDGLGSVLFRSGHLSEVVGVRLTSGRQVVIKVRPYHPRLTGCLAVQDHLARSGFPCPPPLTGVTRIGGLAVTAETAMPGGGQLSPKAGAASFAALLARLIDSAPDPSRTPTLAPSPPWTGWDHPGRRLWPDLDEHGQDLNLVGGPEWVDDAARRVRQRLTSTPGRRLCIGHGDWGPQNIRWSGSDALVVHDWDSVIAQPEAAIVGLAAAMWAREDGSDPIASVAQTADFITSYQRSAEHAWDASQVQDAWAAGLWVGLTFAKQDAAEGGSEHADRLATEMEERLDLAALR